MYWAVSIVVFSIVVMSNGMNRPAYKIAVTQKGFAQGLGLSSSEEEEAVSLHSGHVRVERLQDGAVATPLCSFQAAQRPPTRLNDCYNSITTGTDGLTCPPKYGDAHGIMPLAVTHTGTDLSRRCFALVIVSDCKFLQYDIEVPPLREFTLCTWIRVFELDREQTIFAYAVQGNRFFRVFLEEGGHKIGITITERVSNLVPVHITLDKWHHICLTYQSEYGAYALYWDSKLLACQIVPSLTGYVIPKGGSTLVGYGTTENGTPSGLEGEVFGVNMILASPIERNYTNRKYYKPQKSFERNKLRNDADDGYVVLSDLMAEDMITKQKKPRHYVSESEKTNHFTTLRQESTTAEQNTEMSYRPEKSNHIDSSVEKERKEDLELIVNTHTFKRKKNANFWNLVNEGRLYAKPKLLNYKPVHFTGNSQFYRFQPAESVESSSSKPEPTNSPTNRAPVETSSINTELKPSSTSLSSTTNSNNLEFEKPPSTESIYDKVNEKTHKHIDNVLYQPPSSDTDELSEVELPPAPHVDKNVYGQWTSSKYAGSVLNYLKGINFNFNDIKKAPPTIPLPKLSDHYPYASDTRINIIRPPAIQKTIFTGNNRFPSYFLHQHVSQKSHVKKRHAIYPEINVKVIENDNRSDILLQHAQTMPRNVEITHRGHTQLNTTRNKDENNEGHIDYKVKSLKVNKYSKPSSTDGNHKSHEVFSSNSLLASLPFIKSLEYYTGANDFIDGVPSADDMYIKSLSSNKWSNIMAYNYDKRPQEFRISQKNKRPTRKKKKLGIREQYEPETNKIVQKGEESILHGRKLAMEVSNPANSNDDFLTILKYNHGFLPGHKERRNRKTASPRSKKKNSFNKHIKIGNALNEQHVIGVDFEQKKHSFEGGNETIPDINKYRSDIDDLPDSQSRSIISEPRFCSSEEFSDTVLYVQPDGRIAKSHIMSPLVDNNSGVGFILQNYRECSLEGSILQSSQFVLINWHKTPIRLFGGAHARKTKDLCGFF